MERQDSHLSSSSRRVNSPDSLNTKSIGCMSGIFQLLSKYQHRRKLLTSGKKQKKNPSFSPKKPAQIDKQEERLPYKADPESAVMPENSTVKRRQILGALEKCDEDLKAIKRIIEVLRSAEIKSESQPSPVSVLDELTRSPLMRGKERQEDTKGQMIHRQQQRKKLGEEDMFNISFNEKSKTQSIKTTTQEIESSTITTSKAMIESVNEVCRDITWGQRREMGRIGLALQDFIFRDLIEEILKEMEFSSCTYYPLPLDACRRRLCF